MEATDAPMTDVKQHSVGGPIRGGTLASSAELPSRLVNLEGHLPVLPPTLPEVSLIGSEVRFCLHPTQDLQRALHAVTGLRAIPRCSDTASANDGTVHAPSDIRPSSRHVR